MTRLCLWAMPQVLLQAAADQTLVQTAIHVLMLAAAGVLPQEVALVWLQEAPGIFLQAEARVLLRTGSYLA